MKKIIKKQRSIRRMVTTLRRQEGKVKAGDFQDLMVKVSTNISAEVSEDKNGFLFDSNSGRVYALNKTASFVFSKIKAGLPVSGIVKQLVGRYDIDEGIAASDIQDFLYQLREFNIESEE